MRVDVHQQSIFEAPARFNGPASTKVYDDRGNLVVIVMQHGSAVVVMTADDPEFAAFCRQYGITVEQAEEISV